MRLDKSICKGGKFNGKEIVGIKFEGHYLYETTGPSHLNIYTVKIPYGISTQAVIYDNDDGNKNVNNYYPYVNWGEGTPIEDTSGNGIFKHTYNTYGMSGEPRFATYTVSTTGELQSGDITSSISFPGKYIVDIVSLRTDYKHTDSLFRGYSGIKTIREPVLERLNNGMLWGTSYMFANCTSLEKLNLSVLDVSKVAYMSEMFYNCSSLTELDLSTWGILPGASVGGMFQGCALLQTLRLDDCSVDTINKIITSSGFPTGLINGEPRKIWCKKAVADEIGTLPTGWVFEIVDKEEEPDVPVIPEEPEMPMYKPYEFQNKPNLITVETMVDSTYGSLNDMFYGCKSLVSINTQDWDVSNVSTLDNTFRGCESLTSLDLSNWRLTINSWSQNMFRDCYKLETLDIRNFNIDYYNVEEDYVVDDMFRNCGMLHTIYLNNCNAFTIDQIKQELPSTRYELGLGKGTIYCKKANLIDEGKEINNSTPPYGWKYEFVDID